MSTSAKASPSLDALSASAQVLAAALPAVVLEANRIAISIQVGSHGLRRAGGGDAFWQHRELHAGESIRRVDWRRSARSDKLFVKERERESPALLQIWCDASEGMAWRGQDSRPTKCERALVIALALALSAKAGGERVCTLGALQPFTNPSSFAGALLSSGTAEPVGVRPGSALFISDGLEGPEIWEQRIKQAVAARADAVVLLIQDPDEVHFPYEGRVLFSAPRASQPILIGRAQSAQRAYQAAYQQHMGAVCAAIKSAGGQVYLHITTDSATPIALAVAKGLRGYRAITHPSTGGF